MLACFQLDRPPPFPISNLVNFGAFSMFWLPFGLVLVILGSMPLPPWKPKKCLPPALLKNSWRRPIKLSIAAQNTQRLPSIQSCPNTQRLPSIHSCPNTHILPGIQRFFLLLSGQIDAMNLEPVETISPQRLSFGENEERSWQVVAHVIEVRGEGVDTTTEVYVVREEYHVVPECVGDWQAVESIAPLGEAFLGKRN